MVDLTTKSSINMEVKSQGQFLSPCSNKNDTFGEPSVLPRVGDQYQAEITPMMPEYHREQLDDFSKYFGLAVPIYFPKLKAQMKASQDGSNFGDVKSKLHAKEKATSVLPGSQGKPWTAIERDSLVLALYLFGKNLILVTRFIDNRDMGDILSYYYGEFFRSDDHRRWSESRKMKTRRCINGQKILSGWRHQELLSRLISQMLEGDNNQIKEAATAYADGKTSLEEYALGLKEIVGMTSLVRAVGIGKGKKDLTGTTIEPTKNNGFSFSRSEVPVGKAFAALKLPEIVKLLSGEIRLSKARANDLFWEAVWPRLLARGWHSEQPKSYNYASSKVPLVFIIPGVKKFSRSKLLKGSHFFDCVTDVLNKVASDPSMLEIDNEATKGSEEASEENTSDDSTCQKRRCYLQPRVPKTSEEIVVKFTIVDTSSLGRKGAKIMELRALPVDTGYDPIGSGENGRGPSEEPEEEESKEKYSSTLKEDGIEAVKQLNGRMEFHFGKKARSVKSSHFVHVVKRKPLTDCFPRETPLEQRHETVKLPHEKKPQLQPEALVDLELPKNSEEVAKESAIAEVSSDGDDSKAKDNTSPQAQEQPGRRQSTRNRPLTAKALEAIACGFLSTKKKRKAEDGQCQKSRSVRVKTVPSSSASNGSADTDNA